MRVLRPGIVIQGPTDHYEKIIHSMNHVDADVVWSCWNGESKEAITNIFGNMNIVVSDKPLISGFGNINLQTFSTIAGINSLSNEMILKIRSDMLVSDFNSFMRILERKSDLSFLCMHDITKIGVRYAVDYISFGSRKDSLDFWDVRDDSHEAVPAEVRLLQNFSKKRNMSESQSLMSFDYFLKDINDKGIRIDWLEESVNIAEYIQQSDFVPDKKLVCERLS